jgi:uncharacterized protein YxjI
MNYPLDLSFKLLALASQIYVRDATGNLVLYAKQKMFKLKEAITIFADEGQTQPLYTINADRVLDFSARYHFAAMNGAPIGAIKRQGMKSIWRARYDLMDGENVVMTIQEENGWVKVLDALIGEVPVLGMFTGYLFNPTYLIARPDGTPVMRITKQPAFFEGKFKLEQIGQLYPQEELRTVLGVVMMLLLERSRG